MGRLKDKDEGAVAVEAALVFPILVIFLIGIISLGIVLNAYQSITHAAYEGARYAALLDPVDPASAATVQDRVEDTIGSSANSPLTEYTGCSPGPNSSASVTVTASVNAVFFNMDLSATGVEKCA